MAAKYRNWFELQSTTLQGGNAPEAKGAGEKLFATTEANMPEVEGKKAKNVAYVEFKGNAAENSIHYPGMIPAEGEFEKWTYWGFFSKTSANPGATKEVQRFYGTSGEQLAVGKIDTSGNYILCNAAGTEVKKVTSGMSTSGPYNSWHFICVGLWIHSTTAASCKMKLFVDGKEELAETTYTGKVFKPEGMRFGWITAEETAKIFFTGLGINNETGATENTQMVPRVAFGHLPASDKERVGFTAGAGGTTELFKALNHSPSTGVVLGSATNTSQIKDATENATDKLEVNLEKPEVSIGASDTQKLSYALMVGGYSTITSQTLALSMVSNPEITEVTVASGTTAAASYPTGWKFLKTAFKEAPALTLSSSPVLKLRKGTSTVNSCMYSLAWMTTEFVPVAAAATTLPYKALLGVGR